MDNGAAVRPDLCRNTLWRSCMNPVKWHFPYPSRRMPVMADNVVATSQPLAAQAGLRMLLTGGNAVDAAIAAAAALAVVEPTSNGLGGDAFALVWDAHRLHGINGSGRSPAAWTPDRFKGLREMPAIGWDTVTVPGAVRLPMKNTMSFLMRSRKSMALRES